LYKKLTGMHKKIYLLFITLLMGFSVVNFVSCRKDAPTPSPVVTPPPPPAPDPCAGKTIVVSAASTVANCTSDGTVTITATGSTGFTYKLNAAGTYQASNSFAGLAAATYTVFAKDVDGCEKTASVTVGSASAISVTSATTNATNCAANGSITVTAIGGTGFTYKLNAGGTYQASNVFNNVAAGAYIVFAKSAGGCEGSASATVSSTNTITVGATPVASANCGTDGTITVNAAGSTGFTYKLNAGGTYQASNIFTGLAAGAYTVFAKDGGGCENSAAATVAVNNTAGPLFTNVRSLLNVRCVSCHNNTFANGGANWQVDCNIVTLQARINQRAVVEGSMPAGGPPLTAAEKAIITNWIAAGGKFTD
jgi:ribosomal protein S27E